MGSRGPKPGFKLARAQKAALAATSQAPKAAAPQPAAASPISDAQQPPAVMPPVEPTKAAPPAAKKTKAAPPAAKKTKAAPPELSAADRENPDKLSGQALRDLAHRRGIAKSVLPAMTDEKIRTELRYATYRQYEDAVA